jgi:Cu-processing system permease protein
VSLLIPSDAIWRGASFYLQPASMLAMPGRGTSEVPLPLVFASTTPPPPSFLLWALLHPLVFLAGTTWTFSRRDL